MNYALCIMNYFVSLHTDNFQKWIYEHNQTSLFDAGALAAVIFLSGCGGNTKEQERQRREAEDMVYAAYLDKDYPRIIELVDSFKPLGSFTEGKACYWMGYAYDRMMQKRMAELYWKTGIAAVENSTDDEDVRVYAGITNRLTGLLSTWTEFEAALKVAIPATERLKSLGRDTTSEYTNMLIYIGCSQSRLGLSDDKTDNRLEEAYSAHIYNIHKHPNAISFRDAIVGVINISYNYLEIADYKKAVLWLERLNQLIDGYEKQADARPDYSNKQRARYNIYLARALEGMGRKDEAAEAYRLFCQTDFFRTAEGKILASDYLRLAGRWQDAADNFGSLDEMMKEFGTSYSLENIQKMLLKKYEVNKKAGRIDTARAVSLSITERLDSAITLSRIAEAREEAAVHQKELEMTAENERYVRQRHIGRLIGMAATILFLLVYIIVRHRMGVRLRKAHNDLHCPRHTDVDGAQRVPQRRGSRYVCLDDTRQGGGWRPVQLPLERRHALFLHRRCQRQGCARIALHDTGHARIPDPGFDREKTCRDSHPLECRTVG